jgi:transcriptional regulator with XRE-family HTH domain
LRRVSSSDIFGNQEVRADLTKCTLATVGKGGRPLAKLNLQWVDSTSLVGITRCRRRRMKSAGKICTAKEALREEEEEQRKEGKPVLSPHERSPAVIPNRVTMSQAKYVEPFVQGEPHPIDEARAKEIGARLRELRKNFLDISSQEVFGAGIGVSRGAVANWEVGKGISRVNLYRVSEYYQVSMVWLSTGKGQPRGRNNPDLTALIEESGLSERSQEDLIEDVKALISSRIKRESGRGNGPNNNTND